MFAGSDSELQQLRLAYKSATEGEGSLAVLVREPGVGKTILCVPVVANVGRQHGQALLGHGYEPCLPSREYEPFLEAPHGHVVWAVRHDPARQAMGEPDEWLGLAP